MRNIINERMDGLTPSQHNELGRGLVQVIRKESERLCAILEEIKRVACGEDQIESDGAYDDSDGIAWIFKRIEKAEEEIEK